MFQKNRRQNNIMKIKHVKKYLTQKNLDSLLSFLNLDFESFKFYQNKINLIELFLNKKKTHLQKFV